jgi:REP element-mobilizing transposase RayT
MPRPPRRKDAGLLRHVISRGNAQQRVFLDDRDYKKFCFLLLETVETYDVEFWDFCVMPTHFHLALFHQHENLSEAIQFLKGEYATWWNATHHRVGHVFEGPFKDQIVQQEGYAMSLARYIALNPVRQSGRASGRLGMGRVSVSGRIGRSARVPDMRAGGAAVRPRRRQGPPRTLHPPRHDEDAVGRDARGGVSIAAACHRQPRFQEAHEGRGPAAVSRA